MKYVNGTSLVDNEIKDCRKKYKALDIKVKLPPELEDDITNFLNYLNEDGDHLSEDYYRTEINCTLNWCIREKKLDDETIQKLKAYYVFEGIYKSPVLAEDP